jgi:hypothetical protein
VFNWQKFQLRSGVPILRLCSRECAYAFFRSARKERAMVKKPHQPLSHAVLCAFNY